MYNLFLGFHTNIFERIQDGLNLPTDVSFPCIHNLILDKSARSDKAKLLAKYFMLYRNMHNFWAIKLIIVDIFYLINVLGNIYFIDAFLQGEFTTYGLDVLNFLQDEPEHRVDPMAVVFPTVTKCTFRKFGASGTITNEDALCLLPINIVNQKLYVFLWFWLVILCVMTATNLLMHMLILFNPVIYAKLQIRTWKKRTGVSWNQLGKDLHLKFGDWKLLSIISRNMEPMFFRDFTDELVMKGRAMRNGDVALKPLNRSLSSNIGHQKGLQYKQAGSRLTILSVDK